MGLEAWTARLSIHRHAVGLIGLLMAFTGISLVLNPTHAAEFAWLGVPILALGFGLFVWVVWLPTETVFPAPTLGARFLDFVTWHGSLSRLFPLAGIALIAADLAYNMVLSRSPALLAEDILVLLTAAAFLGYGLVPRHYSRERDFVLLFFITVDAILVAPLLLARVFLGSVDVSIDVYSWTALPPELRAILSGLGVSNSVHSLAGYTAPGLTFTPAKMNQAVTLVITVSCSGIYSFGFFAAGYIAFLLTEYAKPSLRLWLLMSLGFLAAYIANLFRMVVIVLVGYYTDSAQTDLQNLLFVHSYAGWVIFLAWITLFWSLLFKFLPIDRGIAGVERQFVSKAIHRPKPQHCGFCQAALNVSIPAARCTCGAIYHTRCFLAGGRCPICNQNPAGDTSSSVGNP